MTGSDPEASRSIGAVDAAMLLVAVAAISSSAPIVRVTHAPALAIACWRMVMSSALLVPAVLTRPDARPTRMPRPARVRSVGAGLLLAAHFATWIPSLELTSVAASVTLVCTQPIWTVLFLRRRGVVVARRVLVGIALALVGVVITTGVDLSASGRALAGDALALAGGVLAAAYTVVGSEVRAHASTTAYTAACYPVAAIGLFGACVVGGQRLIGFSGTTWLWLAALALGPQLLGHSVFNRLVKTIGPTLVSISILGEIVGSTLIAAVAFGEIPSLAVIPASVLIGAGVVLAAR